MFLPVLHMCLFCLLRAPLSLALTLPPIPNVSSLTLSTSGTNKTFPGSASLLLDVPAVAVKFPIGPELPEPTCNGDLLGFDLNKYSCLQTWNLIPVSKYEVTFGEKFVGDSEVKIPRRYSGRKYLVFSPVSRSKIRWTDDDSFVKADGSCVVDVFHKDGAPSSVNDISNYRQISSAAEKVYGSCVARGGQRAQGGWIGGLGRSHSFVTSEYPV